MKQIYLKTKIVIAILFFVFISNLSFSQTTLTAGDIAFIGFHADDQDGFTFILLKDISANTVIYFTSQGWDGSNTTWYTGNGGHFSWTAPPGGLTTGTIVYITETAADLLNASSGTMSSLLAGNAWALASSGDQVLAYQSSTGASPVSPSFIAAVDADYFNSYDGADGWTTSYNVSTIGYASYVPPGLTNGVNCVALANASQTIEYDNFKYTGTLSGTTTEVRTAINTYSNWTGNNSAIDISVSAYSTPNITTPAVAPTVTTQAVSSISATTATGNGTITSTGNANISERGIYWSTTDGFADGTGTKVSISGDWGSTGDFTQDITGLEPNTTYYVKAFATNSAGTGYGSPVSFTTGIGELVWNGLVNSDWGTAENWTPSIIPTAGYNVTIPAGLTNYPTLSSAGACNNLAVESNASSTGSLIGQSYLTVNGTTNIQRYMTGVDKWHLISVPLEGQGINDLVVTNLAENAVAAIAPKYGLAHYNNSTPGWNHYTTPAGANDIAAAGNFIPGKGYEVLRTADGTITFIGTLSTSDVDIAISKNANGWNLVGNPYPSAINGANIGSNFLSTNASAIDDNYEAIYVWDAANSNYITINYTSGATYVAPGQAFFVYSVEGGSVINFNETMQTHQTGNIFKSGEMPAPTIKLIAERSQGISATKVLYLENATTGLDTGYDAGRFSAGNNSFAVYTHLAGDITSLVDFDIQCLPASDFSNVIPVGLNAPANTNVVFSAETLNLPITTSVILEDRLTGIVTNLSVAGSTYEVNITEKTEGTGRFFLHTQKTAVTGIYPDSGGTNIKIIPHFQNNSLGISGNMGNKAEISVYDMLGRKLIQQQLTADEFNEVKMNGLKSGTYVVFIQSSTQKINKKISWIKK